MVRKEDPGAGGGEGMELPGRYIGGIFQIYYPLICYFGGREREESSIIQASEASYGIITRLKKGVVCSTTPPRSLVLPGPKGVQSVLGGWENVFKGSWTSPS